MKLIITFLLVTTSLSSFSQLANVTLDYNDISAKVYGAGLLFNDLNGSSAGFEYPKGSGKTLIYSMADWYSGSDINSALKMAASEGQNTGAYSIGDFYPGPLTVNPGTGTANTLEYGEAITNPSNMYFYDKVWVLRKTEIDSFVEWFTTNPNWPGYTPSQAIWDWPAHGDVSAGMSYFLAPFVDYDSNGSYNPSAGDYPDIKGDFCAFTIYNDKGGVHLTSGADPIGLEIHQMVYGYITDPMCAYDEELSSTLFIDRRIINRGIQTLYDFSMGLFFDPDLGNYNDDYVGCDVDRSMIYAYNGDLFDEGASGYGANIPAIGLVVLEGIQQDPTGQDDAYGVGVDESINGYGFGNGVIDDEKLGLTGFTYLNGGAGLTTPTTAQDRYNLMKGNYTYGSPFLDPGGQTSYMFPDNSNPNGYLQGGAVYSPWSETSAASIPGNRQILATSGDNVMTPGEYYDIKLAVVVGPYASGGTGSVVGLQSRVDTIRSIYNIVGGPCPYLGVEELIGNSIKIYPNPAKTILDIEGISLNTEITLLDSFGSTLNTYFNQDKLNIEHLKAGVYFIRLKDEKGVCILRFVKQ